MFRIKPTFVFLGIILASVSTRAGNSGDHVRSRMLEILNQVASLVQHNYYDPALKGIDWKGAVDATRQRIRTADNEGDMTAAISGLLSRLSDSHTYFVRPQRLQPVIFGFDAEAFGDDVRIFQIMPGGPAEAAGLRCGDRILGVQGFVANRKLIDDEMRYFEYLDPRLTLTLRIAREGSTPKDYIIKGKQPATSSKEFVKTYEEYKQQHLKGAANPSITEEPEGIEYLKFPTFMIPPTRADSVLKQTKDARALILDLRNNGGGRDDTLQEMASHFFDLPTEVMLAIGRDKKEELVVKPKRPEFTAPLFVLVDSHSASASEIMARILQLRKRATIIGDVTAGKVNLAHWFGGMGGAIYEIPFAVSITVARIVMPDGVELEDRGVVPDVRCVPMAQDLQVHRDVCLDEAVKMAQQTVSKGAAVTASAR